MTDINEPINVWVFFKNTSIQPYLFIWKNRRIKVEKINLIHTSKIGSALFYHFSVTCEGNFYRLKFDTSKMKWFLEMVDLESDKYRF